MDLGAAAASTAQGSGPALTGPAGEADRHDGQHDEEEKHAPSEASTVTTAVAKNKADARRDWEAEIIRQKKVAKEEAALLKSGKGKKPTDALKEHSEELAARIAQIRARCAREAEESSADFDEVTGILYSSYARMRAANQSLQLGKNNGTKEAKSSNAVAAAQGHGLDARNDELLRAVSAGTLVASTTAVASSNSHDGTGSPSRVLRALRSSASSASFSGTAVSMHPPPYPQHKGFCCKKHTRAVLDNREVYLARRKVERALELTVLLGRLPSAQHGYVTSHSLRAIAARYLASYRGMPARSADPALVGQSVEASRLDLPAQRAIVLCVQPKEVMQENLASVLPVVWHCPRVFVRRFADLLEELDRERLEDEAAVS
jgi:NADH dehydrogenase/NADH:ubiquinone oxidoreductase subunit G